ncbi:MAG TPA: pilus assembly protein TadG-related protein [Acidimicrobiia bacterium]
MRTERGSVTMWMLGLSLLLLAFGGLAVDYWRALALQRELAAVADSAAVAGASGIDEGAYRATGELILDPDRAFALVARSIDFQGVELTDVEVTFGPGNGSVTVSVWGEVEPGLLGLFIQDDDPLEVSASATAFPVRVP